MERGRLVFHLLPADQQRGAQRYARLLADGLDRPSERHRVVTVFRAGDGAARPDHCLDIEPSAWGRHFDPRAVRRFARLVEAQQPDVVVAHGSEVLRYVGPLRRAGVRLVLLRVGTNSAMRPAVRRVHQYWQRRADAVVGVSSDALRAADELGFPATRPHLVIPNGRSPQRYRPRARPVTAPAAASVRLVWVGSLDGGKRPLLFLDTVRELRRRGLDVDATLIGDGPLRSEVETAAAGVGAHVLGTRTDVDELLPGFDLLLFTARPPEGMPGVLIEAGLCGVVAVTTRVPGAGDVIEHGVTGMVVEDGTPAALADAVAPLVTNLARRASMAEAARRRCVERFSLENTFEQWRGLLATVARR